MLFVGPAPRLQGSSLLQQRTPRRTHVAVCAYARRSANDLRCPYSVLGLDPGASEKDVKVAYRQLAKAHHPDVNKDEASHLRFIEISQAYEFLCGLARGKDMGELLASQRPGNSAAFHDWFWSFRLQRTWAAQSAGRHAAKGEPHIPFRAPQGFGATTAGQGPQDAEALRTQLAGLRHRAALRKQRATTTASAAATGSEQHYQHNQHYPAAGWAQRGSDGGSEQEDDGFLFIVDEGPSDSGTAPVPPVEHHLEQQQEQGDDQDSEAQRHAHRVMLQHARQLLQQDEEEQAQMHAHGVQADASQHAHHQGGAGSSSDWRHHLAESRWAELPSSGSDSDHHHHQQQVLHQQQHHAAPAAQHHASGEEQGSNHHHQQHHEQQPAGAHGAQPQHHTQEQQQQQHVPPRRGFVAGTEARQAVREQLTGMRRKAMLKQQMFAAQHQS